MMGLVARTVRRMVALGAVGGLAAVLMCQDACIIASDGGDLRRVPATRPTIVHASLVPTTNTVLTEFPVVFLVPVELSDPTVTFFYAAFIDYNPLTGEGLVDQLRDDRFVPGSTQPGSNGRIRDVAVNIPAPDLTSCHKIEIVVALSFSPGPNTNAHTPDEPGGDIATWFYNPTGYGACPSLDAGIAASVDAGPEGGEGGSQ